MISGYTVDDLVKLRKGGMRFRTILADPPWQYDQSPRGAASRHYATMSLDEIMALPVDRLADDPAHLHLWVTHSFLYQVPEVVRAWGFEPKSIMVWVKPTMGNGFYWRCATEFLVFAKRGHLRFRDRSLINWVYIDRNETHSGKPEVFRKLIERVSPPPYLELFGRHPADNWVVFGNEIERGLFDDDILDL